MDELPKYISLQIASQHCDYSQEYLSLRARQGKLKSVKFGRNWVTTKEWLEEYLKNYSGVKTNEPEAAILNANLSTWTKDNFINEKKSNLPAEPQLAPGTFWTIPPEIVQEAALQVSPLPEKPKVFYKTIQLSAAAISVALAVFFLGMIFSSSRSNFDWLLEGAKASAASAWDKFGRTTEIKTENSAIIDGNINGDNYECQCNCAIR